MLETSWTTERILRLSALARRSGYEEAAGICLIRYQTLPRSKVELPKRSMKGRYDDEASLQGRRFCAG